MEDKCFFCGEKNNGTSPGWGWQFTRIKYSYDPSEDSRMLMSTHYLTRHELKKTCPECLRKVRAGERVRNMLRDTAPFVTRVDGVKTTERRTRTRVYTAVL